MSRSVRDDIRKIVRKEIRNILDEFKAEAREQANELFAARNGPMVGKINQLEARVNELAYQVAVVNDAVAEQDSAATSRRTEPVSKAGETARRIAAAMSSTDFSGEDPSEEKVAPNKPRVPGSPIWESAEEIRKIMESIDRTRDED